MIIIIITLRNVSVAAVDTAAVIARLSSNNVYKRLHVCYVVFINTRAYYTASSTVVVNRDTERYTSLKSIPVKYVVSFIWQHYPVLLLSKFVCFFFFFFLNNDSEKKKPLWYCWTSCVHRNRHNCNAVSVFYELLVTGMETVLNCKQISTRGHVPWVRSDVVRIWKLHLDNE